MSIPAGTLAAAAFREMLDRAAPCARLYATGQSRSRIGGRPNLGPQFDWPEWRGHLLSFVAQVDLAEVRAIGGPDWLPGAGMLFFFYDMDEWTAGFSPDDEGSWAALFDPAAERAHPEREPPEPSRVTEFPSRDVAVRAATSLPSDLRLETDTREMAEEEWRELDDAVATIDEDYPCHQVGGWPRPVQNDDMELECQLVSNGLYCGDPSGYASQAAKELAPGASEWRLLLQLDSDDANDMMWGDVGKLYFWVREQDARAGNFSNVWMILQCS